MGKNAFVGRQEILGREEIMGSVVSKTVNAAKKVAGLPLDITAWALKRTPVPSKSMFVGREEIMGDEPKRAARLLRAAELIRDGGETSRINKSRKIEDDRNLPVEYKVTTDLLGREEIMGAFVGDEARALAEDTRSQRAATRRSGSCGYNSHWNFIKGEESKLSAADLATLSATDLAKVQALAKSGNKKARKLLARLGKLAKTSTSGDATEQTGRVEARQILKSAANQKSISRSEFKKAIWLYAGKQSTEKERLAVGSKMLEYLNKREVKLAS